MCSLHYQLMVSLLSQDNSQQTGHVLMSRILGYEQKRHFLFFFTRASQKLSPNKLERCKGEDAVFKTKGQENTNGCVCAVGWKWNICCIQRHRLMGSHAKRKYICKGSVFYWKHILITFKMSVKSFFVLFVFQNSGLMKNLFIFNSGIEACLSKC